jgi:YVTN family beta-propeller protein
MWTGEVKVIDRATHTVTRTLYVAGTPRRIAFTSDGTAVVANEQGYVTFVR